MTLELEHAGDLWFFLRSVDAAGNGSDIATLGPFTIDHDWLGVAFQAPVRTDVMTEGDVFPLAWWLYDDGASAVQMGRLEYSLDAGATYELIGNLTPAQVATEAIDWTVPAIGSEAAVLRFSVWDGAGRVVRARSERFTIVQLSDAGNPPGVAAGRIALGANQPNPFNPRTLIPFELPRAMPVQLCVYDARGRLVRTLVDGWRDGPRRHEVSWNGTDDLGRPVVSGVYLYRLRAGDETVTRRMTLVR